MANEQVQIEILAEIKKAQSNLTTLVKGFAGLYAAYKTISVVGGEMLDAWIQQEKASKKLEAALKATGKEASISQGAIEGLASELQGMTVYGDEATTSAAAMLQQLANLSQDGLMKVLPLIQDFSAAMGIDLEQAASLVGKTLGSTTNALGRYGIQLAEGLTKEEKFAALTEQLQEKFGGMARAMGETTEGGLKRFQNAIGDLMEVGGKFLADVLNPVISQMTKWAQDLGNLISGIDAYNKALAGDKSADYAKALARVNEEIRATKEEMKSSASIYGVAATEVVAALQKKLTALQNDSLQIQENMRMHRAGKNVLVEEAQAVEGVLSSYDLLLAKEDALSATTTKLFGEVFGQVVPASVEKFDGSVDGAAGSIQEAESVISGATADIRSDWEVMIDSMRMSAEDWSRFMVTDFVGAFQDAFNGLGEALVTGGNVWAAFAEAAKEAIAKILDAIGQQLIVEGIKSLIPIPFLFNPAGAAAAFAGAAAAFTGAGAVRALAGGGDFTTAGPQLLMVGDNPGGREDVSVKPVTGGGAGQTLSMAIYLDSRQIYAGIHKATQNGTVIIDARAVR